jgi:transposase
VFVEQLDWLATNPRYTLRFALHVGLLCRDMPNTTVAAIEHLHRRLAGQDRTFIKGQRYTLLSRWENLSRDGRHSLKKLLAANRRLNTAYVLKEQFGQLWDYQREGWARAFFERWRESLKWQRLKPYEKFAAMIERHWDGIAAYCKPKNKVSLGVVEGLNNKIRVLQRRAYGYRDEEYLKLKIITAFLPPLSRRASRGPL